MAKRNSYDDAKALQDMHEWETSGKGYDKDQPGRGLSEFAMECLNQIKELQEQREQQLIAIQTLDMAILGYSHALQEEMGKDSK